MSTVTVTYVYTHTVAFVTQKILYSLKEIIREVGLSPAKMTQSWITLERGVSAWLLSRHLKQACLEVFDPRDHSLVIRWDFEFLYGYAGDGSMWADTGSIRYHIAKAGLAPAGCDYRITLWVAAGAPDVVGWENCTPFSTAGLRRYAVGTTVGAEGLSASTYYWRKP